MFSFSPVFQAHLPTCTRWWFTAFPFFLTTKKSAPFLQGILSLRSVGPLQPGRTVYIWGTSGPWRAPLLQASLGNRGCLSNKDHKLGGLKQHDFILTLLEARSLQSRIAGWILLEAPREELSCIYLCPYLCPHQHRQLSLCVCLHTSFLKGHESSNLGPTLIHYDLILTRFHLQRPYFQIRSNSQAPEDRTLTYLFVRHPSAHSRKNEKKQKLICKGKLSDNSTKFRGSKTKENKLHVFKATSRGKAGVCHTWAKRRLKKEKQTDRWALGGGAVNTIVSKSKVVLTHVPMKFGETT